MLCVSIFNALDLPRLHCNCTQFFFCSPLFRCTIPLLAAACTKIHRGPDFSFIAYALHRRLDLDVCEIVVVLGAAFEWNSTRPPGIHFNR